MVPVSIPPLGALLKTADGRIRALVTCIQLLQLPRIGLKLIQS